MPGPEGITTKAGSISLLARDETSFTGSRHSHHQAQLVYAASGIVSVTTDRGTWVVPPNRAVWVPAHVEHATASRGPVRFRTLFIAPEIDARLPGECRVVEISPFVRELILRLEAVLAEPARAGFAARLSALLVEELVFLPTQPLGLPMPRAERLAQLCARLAAQPALDVTLEQAAGELNLSRRSFMRQFQRETDMSFGKWRQQARLIAALSLLAEGRSILNVAFDTGYRSPSAFAAAFRKALGKPPSAYFE